jgi:putative membrane protein
MTIWKKTTHSTFAALTLIAMTGAGCSSSGADEPVAAATQGDEVTPAENQQRTLNEGQILQVLATVDTGETAQAQLAITRATSPEVRQFANHMIEQHTRSKEEGAQFAEQSGITLTSSKLSQTLDEKGAEQLQKLQKTADGEFDGDYMKAQVKQHQEVLNKLNDELIPSASPRTREQLETARGMVQHHLERAKQIDSALTKS